MDTATVTQLISSVGFPIVACIALALYVKYQTDKYDKQIETITTEHKDEMQRVTEALNNNTLENKENVLKLTEAINNNTIAFNTLCERLSTQ